MSMIDCLTYTPEDLDFEMVAFDMFSTASMVFICIQLFIVSVTRLSYLSCLPADAKILGNYPTWVS